MASKTKHPILHRISVVVPWLYHVFVHPLAEQLVSYIRRRELLHAGDRVGVAVSGGIDSVALLRLLLEFRGELGIVLSVVHFNHKLRVTESDADEEFVANLAREHDLEFHADRDDVAQHAAEERLSLESAARELRYGFFRYLLGESGLDKICTGHTLDDQAETVLMRLIRGAGLRGLGGIHPRIVVDNDEGEPCGEIVRPLLETRRRHLEPYLNDIGQHWHEDSTNTDTSLTRNRVRKLVVPLLEREFNPSVAEGLSDLAEIARGEEDYWENEAAGWLGTTVHWAEPEWSRGTRKESPLVQISLAQSSPVQPPGEHDLQSRIENAPWLVMNASVSRMWFLGEPIAVQRRVVKFIGEQAGIPLEFKHVEEIVRFAAEDETGGKELSLPRGWKVVRQPEDLLFATPDLREPVEVQDYEHPLAAIGRTEVAEAGFAIATRRIPANAVAEYNSNELLDADSLTGPLMVRNWRAGDRYWPAHTKSPKKIKELLQERHVAQPERGLWPVVSNGDEIVWMRGFPVPARYRVKSGHDAVLITETPLAEKPST